jgi:Ca2+-binding RTX toxin-like protein
MSASRSVALQTVVVAVLLALVAGAVLIIHPALAVLSEPPCTVTGTSGSDVLEGSSSRDIICGLGGNDTIKGLGDNDLLNGGPGADKLFGGQGDDTLDGGGSDFDSAAYSDSKTPITASLVTNTATGEGSDTLLGIENLTGGHKADSLTGSDSNNVLSGRGGADEIFGLDGVDKLTGGISDDSLRGGAGNDTVTANGGSDDLFGEEGEDSLDSKDGVEGNDALDGGDDEATCTTDATEKSIVGCKDTIAPTVTSASPTGKKVSRNANMTATFSEAMDEATITGTTFKLFRKNSTTVIPATVTYNATEERAILNPSAKLRRKVTYKAIVAADVADLAGNQMGTAKVWSFSTKR